MRIVDVEVTHESRRESDWTWDRLSWCGQAYMGMPSHLLELESELVRVLESEGVARVDPMRPIPLVERLGRARLTSVTQEAHAWTLADGSWRISCMMRLNSKARGRVVTVPEGPVLIKAKGRHAIAVATCCAEMLRNLRGELSDDLSALAAKCAVISSIEWS